jgi:hypothetical protein
MTQAQALPAQLDQATNKKVALGLWAVFVTYFRRNVLFMNAVNISQPMQWLKNLTGWRCSPGYCPACAWLSGCCADVWQISDMYGRRSILLTSMGLFLVGAFFLPSALQWFLPLQPGLSWRSGMALWPHYASRSSATSSNRPNAQDGAVCSTLPAGIAATIAPTMGGMLTESSMGWRGLFWITARWC